MLIVEGPDLVGKTTLCKKLVGSKELHDLGYIYKHFSRLPENFGYYWGYLEHMAPRSVQDRYHMSEIAYAYARGEQQSPLSPLCYRMVDGYLRTIGAFTVVITADHRLLESRYDKKRHDDEMYDKEKVLLANSVFFEMAESKSFTYLSDAMRNYEVDVDAHIHLTEEKPWPSDQDLRNVLNAYLRRHREWSSEMSRRTIQFGRPSLQPFA